jgi:hypothetical protein
MQIATKEDIIYFPAVIKMAATKEQHCSGARLRKLRRMIKVVRRADDDVMAFPVSAKQSDNHEFCAAVERAQTVAFDLYLFADPI